MPLLHVGQAAALRFAPCAATDCCDDVATPTLATACNWGCLPKDWAADPVRRKAAGVPETQAFATKPTFALEQIRQAIDRGVPMGVMLADAGYGDETAFRDGITALGMLYAVGIRPGTTVWAPGTAPRAWQ